MKSKEPLTLKNQIRNRCHELGISMVGFAPVDRWENPPDKLPQQFQNWIPSDFWPQSIYPEARTVIVIGLPVQLPIVETAPSIYYHEHYRTINILLDVKAYEIANYLTGKGYPSISLPRDGYGDIEVLLEKPLSFFSHKHAAYLAGLGSFGLNNILLTPKFGPRVRFTSIFTTANIEADPIPGDDLCTRCLSCADSCPVKAIQNKTSPGKVDLSKGETILLEDELAAVNDFPPLINKMKCARRIRKLRKQYSSPCGICIKVCPVGDDRGVFNRGDSSMYTHKEGFEKYHDAWKHVRRYGSKKP
ncbi:MAG: epoxyqueuosine reductase [Methanobacteriaceae archaeon]|nr:epoxyqueuosine reductase [Methanobacteriaceae archaeon]